MTDLIYKAEVFKIIGAAMIVHNILGPGFLEPVYQEALQIEFKLKNIPCQRELPLTIYYKGEPLQKTYCADFCCYDTILVELKALSALSTDHESQLINYLKATQIHVGLLINFGAQSLEYKRMVL